MTSSSNFVDSTQDELGRGTAHVARSARSAVLTFSPFFIPFYIFLLSFWFGELEGTVMCSYFEDARVGYRVAFEK